MVIVRLVLAVLATGTDRTAVTTRVVRRLRGARRTGGGPTP
ncbi:hypothetical protein [Frankia sp. R82]|nr:hypothetical protein [Frankia sp. R82]